MSVNLIGLADADQLADNNGFLYRVNKPTGAAYTDAYWDQAIQMLGVGPVDPFVSPQQFDALQGASENEARFAAMMGLQMTHNLANHLWNIDNP